MASASEATLNAPGEFEGVFSAPGTQGDTNRIYNILDFEPAKKKARHKSSGPKCFQRERNGSTAEA